MPRHYPAELRRATCERLPAGEAIKDLTAELGISGSTLLKWRRQAQIDVCRSRDLRRSGAPVYVSCMARGLSAEEIESGPLCMPCMAEQTVRKAWTVSGGDARCVFHALLRFQGDDMAEHADCEAVYRRMRELGHPEAF
jgi:transposase-like protein